MLSVGLLVWGLIISVCGRLPPQEGADFGLPVQLRHNLPIEILYTVVPFVLIIGFFAFTARDQAKIEEQCNGYG
ncbi:MAG: hypothetical protein KIT06_00155 [Cryobacterium sp.]|nr:hypothetical protein [Cryobacterium sp.]